MFRGIVFVFVGLFVAFFILVEVMLSHQPGMQAPTAPSPEDVQATKDFVENVGSILQGDSIDHAVIAISEDQGNSMMRVGARVLPNAIAKLTVYDDVAWVEGAVQVPWIFGSRWLNASVAVAPYNEKLSLHQVIIGGIRLPPDLTLQVGSFLVDQIAGKELSAILLYAADEMSIEDQTLTFNLALSPDDRGAALDGVFSVLRGSQMPALEATVDYYLAIREAMESGELPLTGSFVPYIRFTLQAALDGDEAMLPSDRYTAAMIALTLACGSVHEAMAIGRIGALPDDVRQDWSTNCRQLTLHDRPDLRQHFITAAAIQAISNRGVSVSAGEFKELLDSMGTGRHAGFDFTDIAGNNSGIRLSNLMMSSPVEQWPVIIEMIQADEDIIISLDGIPGLLSRDEFEQRFGDVDSASYAEVLDQIESRIDSLPIHELR